MSISSIVQIAERLLSGNIGKEPQAQDKNKSAQTTAQTQANRTEFGDRFTPSERADTANGAGGTGLLQVEQLRFTVVNIQTPTGDAATTNVAAPAVAAVPANTGLTAAAAAPVAVVPTVAVTAATQPATAPATTTATQTQQDLQTLNSALASLGLNAAEIAAFDQYAGILLQFDPNALQDLENQLNLLAAQYQTQNAPAPAATTPAATTTAATTGAATTTVAPAATPSPGFQLNELSITFTGVKAVSYTHLTLPTILRV